MPKQDKQNKKIPANNTDNLENSQVGVPHDDKDFFYHRQPRAELTTVMEESKFLLRFPSKLLKL
jgi:hypothetical protein